MGRVLLARIPVWCIPRYRNPGTKTRRRYHRRERSLCHVATCCAVRYPRARLRKWSGDIYFFTFARALRRLQKSKKHVSENKKNFLKNCIHTCPNALTCKKKKTKIILKKKNNKCNYNYTRSSRYCVLRT